MTTSQGKELTDLGFKEKEVDKVVAFISAIYPLFSGRFGNFDEVIDLCSGNGLASFMFLLEGLANRAIMYDTKRTNNFIELQELFRNHDFDYEFHQKDINFPINLIPDERKRVIISVHPCGNLADRVIKLGVDTGTPFAVMTCCHTEVGSFTRYNLRNPPDSRLMLYDEVSDYLDLVRQRYIEERGWTCHRFEIDKKISPRNHILVGIGSD